MTFTADDIVTVLVALGVLATIIGGLIVNIIMVKNSSTKIEDIAKETNQQSNKLEHIEILVDGRYSDVLQKLADVKKLLAESSGLPHDKRIAEIAQTKADEQEHRVNKVEKIKKSGHKIQDG